MELKEIKLKIRNFMGEVFKNNEIDDDDDIFEKGFVNSLFAMQLVMFVEKEFGVVIENEDLDLKNFRSINSVTTLIQSKLR